MSDRFVFFGTGANFTMSVLKNLQKSGFLPCRVVVPEFPASRISPEPEILIQQPEKQNPLVSYAQDNNIPVSYAPQSRADDLLECLASDTFEFILVACWPYKIPVEVCNTAKKAAVNIHPSLLPLYRGTDPIKAQIENREQHPGVSLHLLSNEFDAGDIIAAAELKKPVTLERLCLENQSARLGAELFMQACRKFGGPGWHPRPQN